MSDVSSFVFERVMGHDAIDDDRKQKFAELVFSAVPLFYAIIPGEHQSVLDIIAHQIGIADTELEYFLGLT